MDAERRNALEGTGKGIAKGKFSTESNPKVLFGDDFKGLEAAGRKFREIIAEAEAQGFRAVSIIDELERVSKIPPERNPEASKIEERVVDGE